MQSGPEQLKDWMRRAKMNQAETARYLGLHEPTVSRILSGTYRPGLTTAVHLEQLTGIPVEAWVASELEETDEPVAATAGKRRLTK